LILISVIAESEQSNEYSTLFTDRQAIQEQNKQTDKLDNKTRVTLTKCHSQILVQKHKKDWLYPYNVR